VNHGSITCVSSTLPGENASHSSSLVDLGDFVCAPIQYVKLREKHEFVIPSKPKASFWVQGVFS
jgi:hypothetical protein